MRIGRKPGFRRPGRPAIFAARLPGGMALLHPRHQDPYMFETSLVMLGRSIQPIPFGTIDGQPTDLFFLICCRISLVSHSGLSGFLLFFLGTC